MTRGNFSPWGGITREPSTETGRATLRSIKTLAFAAVAVLSLAAMPAMAQSNAAPSDPRISGTQGGKVTTQTGKTVQAPPRPAPGSKGTDNGQ